MKKKVAFTREAKLKWWKNKAEFALGKVKYYESESYQDFNGDLDKDLANARIELLRAEKEALVAELEKLKKGQ